MTAGEVQAVRPRRSYPSWVAGYWAHVTASSKRFDLEDAGAPIPRRVTRADRRSFTAYRRAQRELEDRNPTRSAMALERLWTTAPPEVDEDFFMAFAGDDAWLEHGPLVLHALRRRAGAGGALADRLARHRLEWHPNSSGSEGFTGV